MRGNQTLKQNQGNKKKKKKTNTNTNITVCKGMYQVRFCHNGLWKVVILDDWIPCKPYMGAIYTKTTDDELWVALLEKAYAKIYGCYERLVSGTPYHALPDLTGNPAEMYELQDPDDTVGLWEKLLDWNRTENQMMTANCGDASRNNPVEAGLLLDHSYTILDAKEGLGEKLLCIRNPWYVTYICTYVGYASKLSAS